MTNRKILWLTFVAFALFLIPATQARAIDELGPASENLLPKYILGLTILIAAIAGFLLLCYRVLRVRNRSGRKMRWNIENLKAAGIAWIVTMILMLISIWYEVLRERRLSALSIVFLITMIIYFGSLLYYKKRR